MAKPTTRTTIMDEAPIPLTPTVQIDHHPVDWNDLAEPVAERIHAALNQNAKGCRYFNPTATVSCPSPTPAFFRLVRKVQSRWCRRASKTIPRRARRTSSRWISSGEWISDKHARYQDRALSLTGVLYIDGKLIRSDDWPDEADHLSESVKANPKESNP